MVATSFACTRISWEGRASFYSSTRASVRSCARNVHVRRTGESQHATHLRGGHAKGRKNGSSLTHNAQPTFPEARTTTSWLRFFRAEASYHSEALWDFAHFPVRMCQVSSPGSGVTSGRWRRPEMHVSEADQAQGTLSRAGAVARIVPEAEGDGATVTRFCPRWRGRAAAGVAAAAA